MGAKSGEFCFLHSILRKQLFFAEILRIQGAKAPVFRRPWSEVSSLILAMTVYLPVWHSHCTRARFTFLVSWTDKLAVYSCPLLCLQRQVRNTWVDCSTVVLCCQTNLKSLTSVMVVDVLGAFSSWCRTGTEFCERTLALYRQQPEKEKQNVDFSPLEKFLRTPLVVESYKGESILIQSSHFKNVWILFQ